MSNQELIEGLRLHSTALEHTNRKATAKIVAQAADALERYESPSTARQAAPAERGGIPNDQDGSAAKKSFWAGYELAVSDIHKGNIRAAWNDFKGTDQFARLNPAPATADSDVREVSE